MPGLYPPEKLRKYPHLMVGDIRIWEHYLETVDHGFESYDYDTHVGTGIPLNGNWDDKIRSMALALSEKRIDVVGWKEGIPTIIEVKPSAGLAAIGQVLCYRELWNQRFKDAVSPLLMIVTDFEMCDMQYLCGRFGIRLFVLPAMAGA